LSAEGVSSIEEKNILPPICNFPLRFAFISAEGRKNVFAERQSPEPASSGRSYK
jgi:hypothetical protein